MGEIFTGFLWLRLVGLLVLLDVAAVVLGIRSLARGSEILGISILAGVLVLTAAGSCMARRARRRRDPAVLPRS